MEKINFNKQTTICLDFDGDEGSYVGTIEVELDNDILVTYDLSVSVTNKTVYGGYFEPDECYTISEDIDIDNIKVFLVGNEIEITEREYKGLKKDILYSINF